MPITEEEWLRKKQATRALRSASAVRQWQRYHQPSIITTPQHLIPQNPLYQIPQDKIPLGPSLLLPVHDYRGVC